ncbi:unnamed protein product [Brachionus calyciflorus]|uniref:Uncharacterized protein n=1 Tax=Brachionus calyciflorus TaxID=104777 RepID=A0A813TN49_9BILA|nr:unnamed protein product [Brachionus calyciflorus]
MDLDRRSYLNERFLPDDEFESHKTQINNNEKSKKVNDWSIELNILDTVETKNSNFEKNSLDNLSKINSKTPAKITLNHDDSIESNLDKQYSIAKSSYSLTELDEIKKALPENSIEKYKVNFSTLNQKLRSKLSKAIYEFSHHKLPYLERLIRKNGEANIVRKNIKSRHLKYISDLFNTIVDMKWRFILLIFACCFLVSWIFFAILWYTIAFDCIGNISENSFFDTLLFSIETQQTIGYGFRYINSCKRAVFILMAQCGFSVVFESLMGGIVFAKLSRPKKRTETLIFSKKACISYRDGKLCFMVRVGDLRKSHVIHAYIKMYLIRTRITKEGEVIPWNTQELNLSNNPLTSDRLIFMPIIVEHIIDDNSPLKPLIYLNNQRNSPRNARRFKFNDFEIVVILEGTVESTGQTTQARTSFLPSEILWNHVFEPLMDTSSKSKATIDFSKFNLTRKLSRIKRSVKRNLLPKIFLHGNNKSIGKISECMSSTCSMISQEKIV